MRCRLFPLLLLLAVSCSNLKKARELNATAMSASLSLPPEREYRAPDISSSIVETTSDTLMVKGLHGEDLMIMKAIRDEESGEMVATEQLNAAVVVSRFRNIAERDGKVNIEFQLMVPEQMQDPEWQLRFHPFLHSLGDSTALEDIIITGENFRSRQLRGYQRYDSFLEKIEKDTLKLIDIRNLEIFLRRNMPEVYAFKFDTSFVSSSQFEGAFGVTDEQAIDHYARTLASRRNRRLHSLKSKMMDRYVRVPIRTDGVRLDSVLRSDGQMFVYTYSQTIDAPAGLRKVEVRLHGEIFNQERMVYAVPCSDPLTFYISSVSSLVEKRERYMTKVISRVATEDWSARIAFDSGSSALVEDLDDNREEFARARHRISEVLGNDDFVVDSIVIAASASPEGSYKSNLALSYARASEVSSYFRHFVDEVQDSLRAEEGVRLVLGDVGEVPEEQDRQISFVSLSGGENWLGLDALVAADSLLNEGQKEDYASLAAIPDCDERESEMRTRDYYPQLMDRIYPQLRTVSFSLKLHRRNMVKDTVHTTVPDTLYAKALQLLEERDYDTAAEMLAEYADYNTALAYLALNRNASALAILENCPPTDKVNYLMAIAYARQGRERDAVERYLQACGQSSSYIHRGNLDPEISGLITKYQLNL